MTELTEKRAAVPWGEPMGAADRIVVGLFVGVPFAAVLAATVTLWN
jgi:stearoyl-CoA desaturase (delta-9 desaturase)